MATDLVVLGLLSISLERDLVSMAGKMIEFGVLEFKSEILTLKSISSKNKCVQLFQGIHSNEM